jgi:glycosyltransferase involved in cell wall biosynthesis
MGRNTRTLLRSPDTFVYCPYMQGFLGQSEQVITIHDLIAHLYPTRNLLERSWNRCVLPRLARRVRAIFTVSTTAAGEIARYYGMPLDRIHVVPNALDLSKWSPGPAPVVPEEPYLLVVSANRVYKNTTELLLHHRLWAGRYRLKLVSTRTRYGRVVRAAVRDLGLQQRVDFLDGLSERELIELYRGSAAVVFPSLMEGFGRPALEGMAVGRPVILSDIPVHLESFAGAGIFITPGDHASWERAFSELDCDTASLTTRIERGLTIARRHTFENSCQLLTDALLAVQPRLEDLKNPRPFRPAPTTVRR